MRSSFYKALLAVAALAASGVAAHASSVTIGNGPTPTAFNDTCQGCYYILDQQFGVTGYKVTSYSFVAGEPGDITPVIFENTGNGTFTEVGYGASFSASTAGTTYTEAYTSVAGTNLTDANTYFGFYQSTPTVEFCGGGYSTCSGSGNQGIDYINGTGAPSAYLNLSVPATGSLPTREYAIAATASTPEPSSLSLMGLGLVSLAGAVKRRFRS